MIIKIGINGFGIIGRTIFKESKKRHNIKVVAINDLMKYYDIAYLLKYDTINSNVEISKNDIIVDGDYIKILSQPNPKLLNWGYYNADVIIEATGKFLTYKYNYYHLNAGANKVFLTDIPKDDKIPMFIMGVNHNSYNNETIISNASSTTYCIGILSKLLNDNFGIIEGLITNLHSVTYIKNTKDAVYKNIIPSHTNSIKAINNIIPDLKGKINIIVLRVPVNNVSLVDFTVKLKTKTNLNEIYNLIKNASKNSLKGIIGYTKEQLVSSDFQGNYLPSIFDKRASIELKNNFFKLIAWYDNVTAYSSKLLDFIIFTCNKKS